jgi:hypothetical protein
MARKIRNKKATRTNVNRKAPVNKDVFVGQRGISSDKIRKIFGSTPRISPRTPSAVDRTERIQRKHLRKGKEMVRHIQNRKKTPSKHNAPQPTPPPRPAHVYDKADVEERMRIEDLNHNRICYINQPTSIKQILFSEPIARYYHELGYKVIWPLESVYSGMNKHSDYITFIDKKIMKLDYGHKDFFNMQDALIVPLRYSNELKGVSEKRNMKCKYDLWNMPVNKWQEANWKRDKKSEEKLFSSILRLKDGEKYNLVSEFLNRDFSKRIDIKTGNDLKNVYVEKISNFTLLDWSKVIENATTIHTAPSAVMYWIELLNLKNKEIHVHLKFNGQDVFGEVPFKTKYETHNV